MYTKLVPGQIIFYYPHSELFDDVQHSSAFMCKNIFNKDGGDLSERYLITPDEGPMFKICLREYIPSIYEAVKPLTHGITNAFYDAITGTAFKGLDSHLSTLTVEANGDYVVIRTVDHGAYNPNDVKLVDSALQSAVEQGCLAEFYSRVVQKELTEVSVSQAATKIADLLYRIVPLRKKSVL